MLTPLTHKSSPLAAGSYSVSPPLCVDLDGTLVLSDLFLESILQLLKRKPFLLLLFPYWLLRGRSVLKDEIAARTTVDPTSLPYNYGFIRWLKSERRSGRSLWLCTASHHLIAARVAAHLKLFDGIMATDRLTNLAGKRKAAWLVERFGERGFDYCGNEWRDMSIWRRARGAIIVHRSERLLRYASNHVTVLQSFPRSLSTLRVIMRALRPHQWAKNILIIVPLLAAHRVDEVSSAIVAVLAFITFCLCASSVYILNDFLDLEADRSHMTKRNRPFASGELPISIGIALGVSLFCSALTLSTFLSLQFALVLSSYYALTVAYSFSLKGIVLIDVLTLAGLYTLRVVAGSVVVGVPLSFWLLWFSMFLFLSLAFVKRFAELDTLLRQRRLRAAGRDYTVGDLPTLQCLGSAAGYLSVVVLALYVNSPEINALYRRPTVIWLLSVLVLYWISRVWLKAKRGEMHDDPVVFAIKDRASQLVCIIGAAIVLIAI